MALERKQTTYLWLGISLLFSLYYGIYFYYFVFSQEYIVQDDVRQHIVWLERFVDRELFSQDIIANYFYSLAPLGFKSLYISLAKFGLSPLLAAKILPPILAIVTTIYVYLFTLKIFPLPIAGFFSSLLMNQLLWLNDDLVSATHRAFIYPLFAAFLYYWSRQLIIPCLIIMLFQGLFYPHIVLIEMVILSLNLLWFKNNFQLRLKPNQKPYFWWMGGLIITAIALYPITQKPPELAVSVTAEQMGTMAEFNLGGRNAFFGGSWWQYWFVGSSGLSLPLFPTIVWLGISLPWLWKKQLQLPITNRINRKIVILNQVIIASLSMFFLAHILLPKLHLPSRYTYHTLRFILAISAGIVLAIFYQRGQQWLKQQGKLNLLGKIKLTLVTLTALTIIIFPGIPNIFTGWFQNWKIGTAPEIYQYLAQQPKDTMVASLSEEVNNIPAFSHRSILVGREFAMAYHPAYYELIKQRTIDLMEAQYSFDPQSLKSFIERYSIDYFLLDRESFTPGYLLNQDWLVNSSWSSTTKAIDQKLRREVMSLGLSPSQPFLADLIPACSIVSTNTLYLLDSNCIVNSDNRQ